MSTVADANNNLTTNVYADTYDRVSKVEFPSPTTHGTSNPADTQGSIYDNNGNVLTLTQRSDNDVTLTYDALEQAADQELFGRRHPERGLRLRSAEPTTVGLVHPDWGHARSGRCMGLSLAPLSSETSNGRALSYAYDLANNLTGITWPDTGANALTATYVYDALNRVTQIQANATAVANYAYDDLGRRTNLTPTNGAATTYGYDLANRINSLAQTFTSTANNVTFSFAYNPADQARTPHGDQRRLHRRSIDRDDELRRQRAQPVCEHRRLD